MTEKGYCTWDLGDAFDVSDVGFGCILDGLAEVEFDGVFTYPVQAEYETRREYSENHGLRHEGGSGVRFSQTIHVDCLGLSKSIQLKLSCRM